MTDVVEFKQRNRATWAAGDFDVIAERIWKVGASCVKHAGVREGDDVLDVACGTGNAALRAAQAGGRVTGGDLTPELFEAGRRRAAALGVEVDWVQADAEDLPFEDAAYDAVLSTFGCMFAPRHELAAGEIARVLRPGGRMALCNWTPEGEIGDFFRTIGGHMPPPPEFAQPPLLWGTEDHVRELFDGTGIQLEFSREEAVMEFGSAEEAVEEYETKFGPVVMAKAALEAQGAWEPLRNDLLALFRDSRFEAEYLVVRGTKSG
ncbi:MAG: class I SAM-dependent methyltransferase [Thermoleophilaceae bacterium]